MNALPPIPTDDQRLAADPGSSVWVTASAGTGKTRVLADRVLRLLLQGVRPDRILCLTFTKAAAAEMTTRITRDLGRWATVGDAELAERVRRLTGIAASPADLVRARRLFAQALEVPGGLKIQTLHAFAQALLARFPLEAGVPPSFTLIEDRTAAERLHAARDAVLRDKGHDMAGKVGRLAIRLGESRLTEALQAVLGVRAKLASWTRGSGEAEMLVRALAATLGIAPEDTPETLARTACTPPALDRDRLLRLGRAMVEGGGKTDGRNARILLDWLALPEDEAIGRVEALCSVFLTKEDAIRRSLVSKPTLKLLPEAADIALIEAERLFALRQRLKAAEVVGATADLLAVGIAVLRRYQADKQARAELDFEDLIAKGRALLAPENGLAAWVLYKLDEGLDHVLVDEAQDTSPGQWDMVQALVEEFFAGSGARTARRTLFVVGDEKQSIYSFQGADLSGYRARRGLLRGRAQAAMQGWADVSLSRSFRSTEPVLRLVDAVFAPDSPASAGVAEDAVLVHQTSLGDMGSVELWPLARHADQAEILPEEPPLEPLPFVDPKRELARTLAETIAAWTGGGLTLASGKPASPGDVMVLLPRRGEFQGLLVRALKTAGIPVAGADRVELTGQLAVMDLMALGDVLLLPEDDLSLATVLRGPLFGLDEEALFDLCHGRTDGMTVFDRLRDGRDDPRFSAAYARIGQMRNRADFMPPYELFATFLGAGGGRARLLAQLGPEAAEPIEAFLAQALAFERGHVASLQGFLHWLRLESEQLKRDPDRPRDEVRVMTVHGAKGLEAPVVILADAAYQPQERDPLVWQDEPALPFWRGNRQSRDAGTEAICQAASQRMREERNRLLYVALTRAREHLVVAGWQNRRGGEGGGNPTNPTWYDHVRAGLERLGDAVETAPLDRPPCLEGVILRLRGGEAPPATGAAVPAQAGLPLAGAPSWWHRPAPEETVGRPLSPSRFNDDAPPAGSPLGPGEANRFLKGRLVHRLLQILPDLPPEARPAALERHLAVHGQAFKAEERARLARQVEAIVGGPGFAPLFEGRSRAEVAISGRLGDHVVSGQVDRLVVLPDAVLIADYKTDRAPPARVSDTPLPYRRQLAAYRAILRLIYPGRAVRCCLVWTEAALLQPIPDDVLDAALAPAPGACAP
ncbi:double-strand break repair helicase AddA [Marinivivus vitaminiproducens]|uniref:double-strand break repair helicase AddA n=1 Tax=Marinivivus vitaminiproducens TaxID=3035935 RepID=UPI00279ACE44|nr:double-strand break repair helicase AddA [Geminicoccaceae bacterium SCSIO 64248]